LASAERPIPDSEASADRQGVERRRTPVYLICSPQARVGKTLTARLLLDHLLGRGEASEAFDANHREPRLAAAFPLRTAVIDLATTPGRMALFDRLIAPDGNPKVIDLWHVSYETFWKQAADLDFFEEAWEQGIDPAVLLHSDRKGRFAAEIAAFAGRWPRLRIVLAHNEGLVGPARAFRVRPETWAVPQVIVVPDLDPTIRDLLEQPDILVHRFIRAPVPEDCVALQERMRDLLAPVFHQFRIMELRAMLDDASLFG
jgi:hypothetical protein